MCIEEGQNETRFPVQQSDTIPLEGHGQSSDVPVDANYTMNGLSGRARHVSPCMRFAIVCILVLVLLVSFASSNPLYTLMFAFLAILPTGIVAKFIMSKLKDDAVSEKFLINQFLIGAVPLSILVILVEFMLGVTLVLIIFSKEVSTLSETMQNSDNANFTTPVNATVPANTTTSRVSNPISIRLSVTKPDSIRLIDLKPISVQLDADGRELPRTLLEFAPMWKVILFLILNAFIVAGFVEEVGKWLVSRRYRKINSDPSNVELGRSIGCSGVLAACAMGALGFATTENLGYVVGLSVIDSKGFPFTLVALALLRGVLAFPVHVGAQFYVGIVAAQKYIFNDHGWILLALFIAVLFHGSFDAAALVLGFFIGEKMWPEWLMAIVVAFQLCLVMLLMLLCRGRYKALLERERRVLPSEEAV